uniref:hypothetical protein n=1 Tax=Mariniflexile sp. TaxID=1979402 RepID=UPI0040477798
MQASDFPSENRRSQTRTVLIPSVGIHMKTSIIQEIVDQGLSKNDFSILDSIMLDKYHLYKEFYTEYSVFYFNERGGKDYKANFKEIEDAKEYLIDLYRVNKGLNPIYCSIKDLNAFNLEKEKVIKLIEEDSKASFEKKKVLSSLILELNFYDKAQIQKLEEELMSYAFLIEDFTFIKTEIFINGIK